MTEEILIERGTTLVRRLRLEPGEALPWHRDPYHRVTVVMEGEELAIEFRDSGERERVAVHAGMVDWDEPTDKIHRGINTGKGPYEEITIFFLDEPGAVHQPTE
jgi:quercetin dioxygenase-like cupin family protein